MERRKARHPVNVSLNSGGLPEHWLVRPCWRRGKLQSRCGRKVYLDGMGVLQRRVREARTVSLECDECSFYLAKSLYDFDHNYQGGLFDGK